MGQLGSSREKIGLWEVEILPVRDSVERLNGADLLRLGMAAIDWTIRAESQQIEDKEDALLVEDVMQVPRSTVVRQERYPVLPQDLVEYKDSRQVDHAFCVE